MMIMQGLSPFWCGFWRTRRINSANPPNSATWPHKQAVCFFTLLFVLLGTVEARGGQANSISSEKAYDIVRAKGILQGHGNHPLVVEDVFDLGRVVADDSNHRSFDRLVFRNVMFNSGIRAEQIAIQVPVVFDKCGAKFIRIADVEWFQPLKFNDSEWLGTVIIKGGHFEDKLEIENSTIIATYFKGVEFKKPFSLINCSINDASFSGSQFRATAVFDGTQIIDTARFYGNTFGGDVSFAEVEVSAGGAIFFQRVEFKGIAEFTGSKLHNVTFGGDRIAIFSKLADFRGCDFGKAVFDKTQFKDRTIFDNALFNADASFTETEFIGRATFKGATFISDVTFDKAHFANSDSSIEGIVVKGRLEISPTSISALRFRWNDIDKAVLTDPTKKNHSANMEILRSAENRLYVLKQTDDALKVKVLLADKARRNELESGSTSMAAKMWIQSTYLFWGFPTAYGTKPWPYLLGMAVLSCAALMFFVYVLKNRHRTVSSSIFISYRRAITESDARLIHDGLERRGIKTFMDVDDIGLGSFPDKLSIAIEEANVLLVVIGPGWTDISDPQGNRRLDNPDDWVRREISLGIEKDALIVPVLVQEEPMPDADSLPPDIRKLTRFQAVSLRNAAWKRDFDHLVKLLAQNRSRSKKLTSTQREPLQTLRNT